MSERRPDEVHGNLTLRFGKHGRLDEVVVLDAGGECVFHLEKTGEHRWYARLASTRLVPLEKELTLRVGGRLEHELDDQLPDRVPKSPPATKHRKKAKG